MRQVCYALIVGGQPVGLAADRLLLGRAALLGGDVLVEYGCEGLSQTHWWKLSARSSVSPEDTPGAAAVEGLEGWWVVAERVEAGMPDWVVSPSLPAPGKGHSKYPWRTLPVGGWFDVAPGPGQPYHSTMRSRASTVGTEMGRKFRCSLLSDGTLRVERLS